jgi:hypothetical protein
MHSRIIDWNVTLSHHFSEVPQPRDVEVFLQLGPFTHQMTRCFVLGRRYSDHAHAVAFAAQPCAQVDDQLDCVEPVALRAPLVTLDGDARGIDDMTLDPASPQRAIDPERIGARFVTDDDAHIRSQHPLCLVLPDQVLHGLQAARSVWLGHRMHRWSLTLPVV